VLDGPADAAARQAWLLSERPGPREKKLRVIDVIRYCRN
jgi:hypothetical protein